MSGPQFTPGPWVPILGEVYRIRADSGNVATVQHVHLTGRRPDDEVVANTCLVAAAPDLYRKLASAPNLPTSFDEWDYFASYYRGWLKESDELLARARGELS